MMNINNRNNLIIHFMNSTEETVRIQRKIKISLNEGAVLHVWPAVIRSLQAAGQPWITSHYLT